MHFPVKCTFFQPHISGRVPVIPFITMFPRSESSGAPLSASDADPGSPLFLTPLLEAGRVEEARTKAAVVGLPDAPEEVPGYSG